MEDELDLVHNLEKFLLAHNHAIEFDLHHLDFVTRFAELELAEAEARQYRDYKADCRTVVWDNN